VEPRDLRARLRALFTRGPGRVCCILLPAFLLLAPSVVQASVYMEPDALVATAAEMDASALKTSLAFADDGTAFAAVSVVSGPNKVIKVYRSLDDGKTWSLWSTLGAYVFAADYVAPTLHMARGTTPRLFLGFIIYSMNGFQVGVAYTDPSSESPTWSGQTLTDLGNEIDFFDIGSTADFQSDYSVFVVTSRMDGGEMRFIRSADKGVTWGASYVTTLPVLGYQYHYPKMAVGFGGVIHVAWTRSGYPTGSEPKNAEVLYQRALKLFQEANNDIGVMQTCNLLGVVERKSNRLAEARTWYERSRELGRRLGDTACLGQAAQNIGIVCQLEGEAARQRGDEKTARQRFEEAKRSLQESLIAKQELGNDPALALALGQLAQVHLLLGELAEAQRHAQQCLEIDERLDITRGLPSDYHTLADIARARGDAAQAAEWERKRDAVRAELQRRARGPGGGGLPPQFAQAVQQLSIACAQAGFGQPQPQDLGPAEESALAQLEQLPAPLPDLAAFLRRLAARELPPIPATLPPDLRHFLQQLLAAAKEAGS